MKKYSELSVSELQEEYEILLGKYNEYKERGLSLDLSRGKPNSEQLDIVDGLLSIPMDRALTKSESGFDCRNYGILDGVPEAKRLFGALREADERSVDKIYAHLPVKDGIGLALYNRLIRAAAHTVITVTKKDI